MGQRILFVEPDSSDPDPWRYGVADAEGRLAGDVYLLNSDPAVGGPPDDLHGISLGTTAILLVRQAKGLQRIVCDLRPAPVVNDPEPPPRGPERSWERSTKEGSRGRGETLGERASGTVKDDRRRQR